MWLSQEETSRGRDEARLNGRSCGLNKDFGLRVYTVAAKWPEGRVSSRCPLRSLRRLQLPYATPTLQHLGSTDVLLLHLLSHAL
jgi:hypothetical protein